MSHTRTARVSRSTCGPRTRLGHGSPGCRYPPRAASASIGSRGSMTADGLRGEGWQ
jgi:hypothetical protein